MVAITTSARNYILRFSLKKGGPLPLLLKGETRKFLVFQFTQRRRAEESRAATTNVTLRPPPAFLAGAPSMVRQKLLYRRAIWGKRQFSQKDKDKSMRHSFEKRRFSLLSDIYGLTSCLDSERRLLYLQLSFLLGSTAKYTEA